MDAQPNGYVSELRNEFIEMLDKVVLPEMSGTDEQCIYKVPETIRQTNSQAYTPQLIAIGPFHSPLGSISDNNNLHAMEEFKLKYLKGFLSRTNLCMDDLILKIQELEKRIRNCYAGQVRFDSKDFLKIIIVDACFIIEHFLRWISHTNWKTNDPIFLKPGLFREIKRDLVLLENQLPFFVLEEIYKLANLDLEFSSFIEITMDYFDNFNQQDLKSERMCPKHFTDLIRTFLIPPSFDCVIQGTEILDYAEEQVYSVSQLSEAGLKFELSESNCFLDFKFDKDVLKIPRFVVHDLLETFMRNILTFEECHILDKSSAYISQYLTILDFLIDTEKDVNILVDKKIIVNRLGDANEVATMINSLCRNVRMAPLNLEYLSLCQGLNAFYENPRNKYKAIFIHEYFNTPWKIASTITAILLVLFTLIQAVCSIWSLV